MYKNLVILLFFMSAFTSLNAYQIKSKALCQPLCILVKINRSENKLNAMKERGMTNEMKDVVKMDEQLAFAIMADFREHFKYCPVYFFDSPSLPDVKSKNWKTVSFYHHDFIHPVTPPDSLFRCFFILENNYPPAPQYDVLTKENGVTILEPKDQKTFVNSNDEFGIVGYDAQYNLLPGKLAYSRAGLFARRIKNAWPKEYTYTYVGALRYDRLLTNYFKKDSL